MKKLKYFEFETLYVTEKMNIVNYLSFYLYYKEKGNEELSQISLNGLINTLTRKFNNEIKGTIREISNFPNIELFNFPSIEKKD